jgi:hypothetical protein
MRAGRWGKEPFAAGPSLAKKRLGVLGLSRIGRPIATRARDSASGEAKKAFAAGVGRPGEIRVRLVM